MRTSHNCEGRGMLASLERARINGLLQPVGQCRHVTARKQSVELM